MEPEGREKLVRVEMEDRGFNISMLCKMPYTCLFRIANPLANLRAEDGGRGFDNVPVVICGVERRKLRSRQHTAMPTQGHLYLPIYPMCSLGSD